MDDKHPPAASGAPSLRCPRDASHLNAAATAEAGAVANSRCPSCEGLFLRSPEILAALRNSGIDRDKLGGIHPIPPVCPGCGKAMQAWIIANLEIDLCPGCEAAWLDKGELDKVNAYLEQDPAKNVDTRLKPSAEDFGVLGGVADAEMDRYRYERGDTLAEILDAILIIFARFKR
jgi:Zn-finger nucleic acid-binding protein